MSALGRPLRRLALALWLVACSGVAMAHAPSTAYLTLTVVGEQVQQRLDVSLRDLDRELALDADDDGRITWGELRQRQADLDAWLRPALGLGTPAGGDCAAGPLAPVQVDEHADGTHAVLRRDWQCPAAAAALVLQYRLFAHSDPAHRAILRWVGDPPASGAEPMPLAPGDQRTWTRAGQSAAGAPATAGWAAYIGEGIHHILIGADHLLFLWVLLLPAVLRGGAAGTAAPHWRPVLLDVARTVSAFTVAHSVTLAVAMLGVFSPPTRWVESLIAASVALTAIDNLRPFLPSPRWKISALFGLVHGFGFAGALSDLGLDRADLARTLAGFNLGVELGQLGVVALWLPLAWWGHRQPGYRRWVLGGGSALAGVVAMLWCTERLFDLQLLA
ncbi:HupE/UreJ family protein [Ideonella alba]|uniref:HupE/UreJ family protein n=1 Tax=Ideonella alba TaxID=2824118 RepID=A0A940YAR9_9BURK|nr:HupE/UreJ family protein [Ideonella alba]MBQ0928850.1 HupE/UreJ family protein [Ideonella alba]